MSVGHKSQRKTRLFQIALSIIGSPSQWILVLQRITIFDYGLTWNAHWRSILVPYDSSDIVVSIFRCSDCALLLDSRCRGALSPQWDLMLPDIVIKVCRLLWNWRRCGDPAEMNWFLEKLRQVGRRKDGETDWRQGSETGGKGRS